MSNYHVQRSPKAPSSRAVANENVAFLRRRDKTACITNSHMYHLEPVRRAFFEKLPRRKILKRRRGGSLPAPGVGPQSFHDSADLILKFCIVGLPIREICG